MMNLNGTQRKIYDDVFIDDMILLNDENYVLRERIKQLEQETHEDITNRLTEDRIAKQNVVS